MPYLFGDYHTSFFYMTKIAQSELCEAIK